MEEIHDSSQEDFPVQHRAVMIWHEDGNLHIEGGAVDNHKYDVDAPVPCSILRIWYENGEVKSQYEKLENSESGIRRLLYKPTSPVTKKPLREPRCNAPTVDMNIGYQDKSDMYGILSKIPDISGTV